MDEMMAERWVVLTVSSAVEHWVDKMVVLTAALWLDVLAWQMAVSSVAMSDVEMDELLAYSLAE